MLFFVDMSDNKELNCIS